MAAMMKKFLSEEKAAYDIVSYFITDDFLFFFVSPHSLSISHPQTKHS